MSAHPATAAEIERWLIARLAERAGIEPARLDRHAPFESLGLSSREAVSLSGELGDWLGRPLSPTLAWEHPSIAALAGHLADQPARDEMSGAGSVSAATPDEPIAIIGIGCRFPGADGPEDFWQLLAEGIDAIAELPADRPQLAAGYQSDGAQPRGGFLSGIDQFAPSFFGIAPREAAGMDPQQRLLLEVAWQALEDAGLVPEALAGTTTGVFIGISTNDYGRLQRGDLDQIDPYSGTGNALSIAANRISYLLDLAGPSLALDTACSSSLVAVQLACESLRRGEASLALAGGVNLMLDPAITLSFSRAGLMASDGRCKTFDARADGYARGEGAGLVVLKRLSQARADNDPIYAVILGGAINQDGRSNGLMAPSPQRQEEVVRAACAQAGVSPGAIQYVEAHGTGTLLGDPIEVGALGNVLSQGRPAGALCAIGSVKTNIGHLEAAAGIAGLIKVALALSHHALPPSLHFEQPNPHIRFDQLPLRVQTTLTPWPDDDRPRLAGVSAFGFGGTNAHLIVSQDPDERAEPTQPVAEEHAQLLPLSARSPDELRLLAEAHRAFLAPGATSSELQPSEIAATAALRRGHRSERLAVVGSSTKELRRRLTAFLDGKPDAGVAAGHLSSGRRHKLAFVFSGHGSQWAGMGRELFATEPVFRQAVERCDQALSRLLDWSLVDELQAAKPGARLDRIDAAQPAIFALQVSLAALWRSWGIEPDAIVGHSLGEVAAAQVAGALSLEDAARVVVQRGRAMQTVSGQGRTALVGLPTVEVEPWLAGDDRVVIAGHNSPSATVLAGPPDALEALVAAMQQAGIFARLVKSDVAFHSPQMDPLLDGLSTALAGLRPRLPARPLYSSVTGQPSQGRQGDASYWARNLRQPVLFAEAVDRLLDANVDILLELSPHPILATALRQCLDARGQPGTVLGSLRQPAGGLGERASLLGALGALYTLGLPVDWRAVYPEPGRPVRLPTYRWQRERHWFQSAPRSPRPSLYGVNASAHPLLHRSLATAHPTWETDLDDPDLAWLTDVRLDGQSVVPASALIELALAAATGQGAGTLRQVSLAEPRVVDAAGAPLIQTVTSAGESGRTQIEIFSRDSDSWTRLASGWLEHDPSPLAPASVDLAAIGARCDQSVPPVELDQWLAASGIELSEPFQTLTELRRGEGEALGILRVMAGGAGSADFRLDPRLLEATWPMLALAAGQAGSFRLGAVDAIRVSGPLAGRLLSHARLTTGPEQNGAVVGDLRLCDEAGMVLSELRGLRLEPRQPTPADAREATSRDTLLALPAEERVGALATRFRAELAGVLGLAEHRIDLDQSLDRLGLDSLMAMEMMRRIERGYDVRLSPTDLLLGPSLRELAETVLARAIAVQPAEPAASAGDAPGERELVHQIANLGALTDEELDALLAEMLTEDGESS